MNQAEINQAEWSDPNNWSHWTYRSRKDSRAVVPQRAGFGRTINFGNKKGVLLLMILIALPIAIPLGLNLAHAHDFRK